MKRTYAYIVVLIDKESEKSFKVAIAATDDDGLKKQIAELYSHCDWYSHIDEKYPLV
jgi:hypothetical protein